MWLTEGKDPEEMKEMKVVRDRKLMGQEPGAGWKAQDITDFSLGEKEHASSFKERGKRMEKHSQGSLKAESKNGPTQLVHILWALRLLELRTWRRGLEVKLTVITQKSYIGEYKRNC